MTLSERLVRLGYQYLESLIRELELGVGEPSWFYAYLKVGASQRLLRRQTRAMEAVLGRRMTSVAAAERDSFRRWQEGNALLQEAMNELVAAVQGRDKELADGDIRNLRTLLVRVIKDSLEVVSDVEALTGDVSQDLAWALKNVTVDRD